MSNAVLVVSTASSPTIERSGTMVTMPRPAALCAPPSAEPLAPDTQVVLDAEAVWLDATHLAGGTPFRIMGLSEAGATLVRTWVTPTSLDDTPGHVGLARRLVDAGLAHPTFPSGASIDEVTVVVPVRDRAEELDALFGSLGGLAVVVVDDASEDPTSIARIADAHGARLIRLETGGGPGAARNDGLCAVGTELVCFIDSDCRPPEGFVADLLPALADPRVALVAPRIRGGASSSLLGRFERACSPLDVGARPALVRPGGTTTFVPSACMLVRRSVGASLFDEDLSGGEDVDLVWRLAEAGWSIRLDPTVVVQHPVRPSLASWLSQRAFYGSTAAALADRHGDAIAPVGGSAYTVGAWVTTLLGWPVAGGVILAGGAAVLSRRLDGVVDQPAAAAARLMVRSSLLAGPTLARQIVRSYGPALLLLSLVSRRTRRATIVAGLLGALGRWWSSDSDLDPVRFAAISVADDAAYGVGLWRGVLRRGRAGALRPRLFLMRRSGGDGATGAEQP